MHSKLRTKNGWGGGGGGGRTGVLEGNFMLGRFFREGKVRPGFFFPRGKIYTGILFLGAILSRGGFSGVKFYAGGNSMLQHRRVSTFLVLRKYGFITMEIPFRMMYNMPPIIQLRNRNQLPNLQTDMSMTRFFFAMRVRPK